MRIGDDRAKEVPLTTSTGFSPRLGPNYLLYASASGNTGSIWKLVNGSSSELWRGDGAKIIGGPVISADSRFVAFSIRQHGESLLYVMQADGTNARVVAPALGLQGTLAWSPDGLSIVLAADDAGVPHLFRVPINGGAPQPFIREYSVDPEWSPDGRFLVYSGPDIGTKFSVKAVTASAKARPFPALTLTRGARHLAFLPGGHELIFLRGDIQHKDLWVIDVETGAERQLINLPSDFDLAGFDISPDGHEIVLERLQESSTVVLLDLARP
jgi:Tol biopolymer transport system component